jgi:ribosomal protein S18 acetylase RimI-like enzyme
MPNNIEGIRIQTSCEGVDWNALRDTLVADDFDNGRTPEEYERSSRNSHIAIFCFDGDDIIGNGRVLSDGVCNAYIVDVWVRSSHRRRGIASAMMLRLLEGLQGQHVYLFTDDRMEFYESLGFCEQPFGMSIVVGSWLNRK